MSRSIDRRTFVAAGTLLTAQPALSKDAPQSGLAGHWKLRSDAKDSSGLGLHAENHGVRFAGNAAVFGGAGAHLSAPQHDRLSLGSSDFSFAVWVNAPLDLDDSPGDIASQWDPAARRGFTLNLKTNSVTTTQSNWRNLHFGIDASSEPEWKDCGRPGEAIFVMGLAVHNGQLYAATCESGEGKTGHVYRYAGGQRWVDCGSPDPSDAISALAVYDGHLYAASARYRMDKGSALPPTPNQNPGGKIYRLEGEKQWVDCGKIGESDSVASLARFRGKLYATSLYAPAGTFRYDGGATWTPTGTPEGRRVEALGVYRGALWGTGYDKGEIYRYDGSQWKIVGSLEGVTQTYSLSVYQEELYVSTWPDGSVYRYRSDNDWEHVGRLGQEREVMALATYNGKFYGGTLPLAEVHRYESGKTWTKAGRTDFTPDVVYRRVFSMAVHQGKLFCGTLPSGHVHSMEAGRSATFDSPLDAGWRHVAAVREGSRLRLYVDGKLVAESSAIPPDFDLTNGKRLLIGKGDLQSFRGQMRDARLYRRALTAREVASLARV